MATIQVGNAPCSWGTLEFEGLEGTSPDYRQVLDEMRETGYAATELGDWGFMPTDPAALRAELDARGLALVGAFVPVEFRNPAAHGPGRDAAVRTARLLAGATAGAASAPFIILADANGTDQARTKNAGRVTPEMGLAPDEWRVFAGGVDAIAREVRDATGLRTAFHHHGAGYVETPGEIDRLLDLTDPSLVSLVFDTGHLALGAGSGDAVPGLLDRWAGRIAHVHFKDWDPGVARRAAAEGRDYFGALRDGVFCELGKGAVDFPAVVAGLGRHGYTGWIIVEQDVLPGMGTPKESARRNREYLRAIGL